MSYAMACPMRRRRPERAPQCPCRPVPLPGLAVGDVAWRWPCRRTGPSTLLPASYATAASQSVPKVPLPRRATSRSRSHSQVSPEAMPAGGTARRTVRPCRGRCRYAIAAADPKRSARVEPIPFLPAALAVASRSPKRRCSARSVAADQYRLLPLRYRMPWPGRAHPPAPTWPLTRPHPSTRQLPRLADRRHPSRRRTARSSSAGCHTPWLAPALPRPPRDRHPRRAVPLPRDRLTRDRAIGRGMEHYRPPPHVIDHRPAAPSAPARSPSCAPNPCHPTPMYPSAEGCPYPSTYTSTRRTALLTPRSASYAIAATRPRGGTRLRLSLRPCRAVPLPGLVILRRNRSPSSPAYPPNSTVMPAGAVVGHPPAVPRCAAPVVARCVHFGPVPLPRVVQPIAAATTPLPNSTITPRSLSYTM